MPERFAISTRPMDPIAKRNASHEVHIPPPPPTETNTTLVDPEETKDQPGPSEIIRRIVHSGMNPPIISI